SSISFPKAPPAGSRSTSTREIAISVQRASRALVLCRDRMANLQSFSSKSQRSQKLKTTFAARKLELCFRGNVISETIGYLEDSLRRQLFVLVDNDQASWLRSGSR